MKCGRSLVVIAIISTIAIVGLVGCFVVNRTRRELADKLERFCVAQADELRVIVNVRELHELQLKIDHRLANPQVSRLCLDAESPLPQAVRDLADHCWIKSGEDRCYLSFAANMLGLYQRWE